MARIVIQNLCRTDQQLVCQAGAASSDDLDDRLQLAKLLADSTRRNRERFCKLHPHNTTPRRLQRFARTHVDAAMLEQRRTRKYMPKLRLKLFMQQDALHVSKCNALRVAA